MQSTMKNWRHYFERNKVNRMAIPWERGVNIESHLHAPLVRSLQRFQVGESGGSGHLQRLACLTNNADYAAAIELFAAEEGEHGRLLAQMLKSLDAPLLDSHWSDGIFVLLRRFGGRSLRGFHIELLTLLIAEMIAKRYYRALYEGSTDEVLRALCSQILSDEEGHVAFHCDYLRVAFAPLLPANRVLVRTSWRTVYGLACLLVLFDHRGVLRASGVSAREWWRGCNHVFDDTACSIFRNQAMQQSRAPLHNAG
ncbi:MAG TPA: hypothetical protein VF600_08845 [Abditibacteriaceae bacterium]|jgi:hypothetical protein